MQSPSPKVALVSGGALGYKAGGPSIGGAIAQRLSKDGFKIVVLDEIDAGQRTADVINQDGGEAIFIKADATKTADIHRALERVQETFGGLHCLVNCITRYSSGMAKNVAEITEEEWQATLDVNLGGYFKMAKYCAPMIVRSGGGTIINISSIEAFTALPNFSVYSVAKAAIEGLTHSLAVDFAPQIRTNAIAPGFVKIANSENGRSAEELAAWYKSIQTQYPMRRLCEVGEVAGVASFLAGEDSSYVNGQTIVVDGGKLIADTHDF